MEPMTIMQRADRLGRRARTTIGRARVSAIRVVRGLRAAVEAFRQETFRRGARRAEPAVADERTIRRMAEEQNGGMSSEESLRRYERGENPGGLHGGAVHADLSENQGHHPEEPQGRAIRRPRGDDHLPEARKGS
jgi:hypothetical protein